MHLLGETLTHIGRISILLEEIGVIDLVSLHYDEFHQLLHPYPQERLKQLKASVTEIKNEFDALNRLYDQQEPQSSINQDLLTVDKILELVDQFFVNWEEFPNSIFNLRAYFRFKSRSRDLQEKIQRKVERLRRDYLTTIDELGRYAQNLMPFPMTNHIAGQIRYTLISQNPQASIQMAFAIFEEHLRNRIGVGPEAFGEELINLAFGRNGRLAFGAVPAEQIGIRNFVSGAYATLRNPRMHRLTTDNENAALAIIALVDLLIRIIDVAPDVVIGP